VRATTTPGYVATRRQNKVYCNSSFAMDDAMDDAIVKGTRRRLESLSSTDDEESISPSSDEFNRGQNRVVSKWCGATRTTNATTSTTNSAVELVTPASCANAGSEEEEREVSSDSDSGDATKKINSGQNWVDSKPCGATRTNNATTNRAVQLVTPASCGDAESEEEEKDLSSNSDTVDDPKDDCYTPSDDDMKKISKAESPGYRKRAAVQMEKKNKKNRQFVCHGDDNVDTFEFTKIRRGKPNFSGKVNLHQMFFTLLSRMGEAPKRHYFFDLLDIVSVVAQVFQVTKLGLLLDRAWVVYPDRKRVGDDKIPKMVYLLLQSCRSNGKDHHRLLNGNLGALVVIDRNQEATTSILTTSAVTEGTDEQDDETELRLTDCQQDILSRYFSLFENRIGKIRVTDDRRDHPPSYVTQSNFKRQLHMATQFIRLCHYIVEKIFVFRGAGDPFAYMLDIFHGARRKGLLIKQLMYLHRYYHLLENVEQHMAFCASFQRQENGQMFNVNQHRTNLLASPTNIIDKIGSMVEAYGIPLADYIKTTIDDSNYAFAVARKQRGKHRTLLANRLKVVLLWRHQQTQQRKTKTSQPSDLVENARRPSTITTPKPTTTNTPPSTIAQEEWVMCTRLIRLGNGQELLGVSPRIDASVSCCSDVADWPPDFTNTREATLSEVAPFRACLYVEKSPSLVQVLRLSHFDYYLGDNFGSLYHSVGYDGRPYSMVELSDTATLDVIGLRESRLEDDSLLVLRSNHPSFHKCLNKNKENLEQIHWGTLLNFIIGHTDQDSNRDGPDLKANGGRFTIGAASYSFSAKTGLDFICAPLNFDIGLSHLKGHKDETEVMHAMAVLLDLSQDLADEVTDVAKIDRIYNDKKRDDNYAAKLRVAIGAIRARGETHSFQLKCLTLGHLTNRHRDRLNCFSVGYTKTESLSIHFVDSVARIWRLSMLSYSRSPIFDFQQREDIGRKMKSDVGPYLQRLSLDLQDTFRNKNVRWDNIDKLELRDDLFTDELGGLKEFISCTPHVSRLLWMSPAIQRLREIYQQSGGDSSPRPTVFYEMVLACLYHSQWEQFYEFCGEYTNKGAGAELNLRKYLNRLDNVNCKIGGGRNGRFRSTSLDREYYFGTNDQDDKMLREVVDEIHRLVVWARKNKPPATQEATYRRLSVIKHLVKGVNDFRIGMIFPLLACSGILGQSGLAHAGNVWPSNGQAAASYLSSLGVEQTNYPKALHILNHWILRVPAQRLDIGENVLCEISRKNEKWDIFYRGQSIFRLTEYGNGFVLEEKQYGKGCWFQVAPFFRTQGD
jgi:hypothetical protein